MRITQINESGILTLERLKSYANIVDPAKDDDLRAALTSAALRVAQYADVALLHCTVVDDVEGGGEVQLWMPPVAEVVSVENLRTGDIATDRCERYGNRLVLPDDDPYRITYSVEPDDAQVEEFVPLVLQMAVAIWDGNTEEESKVYKRIPAGYVVH